jgi:RNA polymerase sigma factor (sigma-70 family)
VKPTSAFLESWLSVEAHLLQTLRKKGLTKDVAQDIIQEVAVIVVRKAQTTGSYDGFLDRFASLAEFLSWARIRASWLLLDKLRADRRLRRITSTEQNVSESPQQEWTAYIEELRAMIQDLPERQRDAIIGLLQGAPPAEIADRMGISEASVRSLQRFGRVRLASAFGGESAKEASSKKVSSMQEEKISAAD